MKRAEQLAWGAFVGLLLILSVLLTGALLYNFAAFWAGTMLAGAQTLVVGLAAWGLMLARQAKELDELPAMQTDKGFRMSSDATAAFAKPAGDGDAQTKTLDTSFQRLLVGVAGIVLLGMGTISAYLLYHAYGWSQANLQSTFPIAGSFKSALDGKPGFIDESGLLIGLSMALLYGVLYWITRPRRQTGVDGEAVSSNFTLGITAMAALAVGTALAYFQVAWASEIAAGVMAIFMLLQGLELVVNAFRSYSAIEELDQDVIDLQATPLTPMLSSIWLAGLRMLFAQSVGLGGKKDRGVIARMMPRALAAIAVIAVVVSCFRVVPPGQVAVLERLGAAATTPVPGQPNMQMLSKDAILQPGLHVGFPWPIDKLVMIPTQQLQLTTVGTELHASKEWKGIDFQFWTVRAETTEPDTDDLFVTGDPAPQILETYVEVRWRVARPELFYSLISHSDFFERESNSKGGATKALTTYEAIIQQCTSFAVTRTFAIHSLEQVMFAERREVELHCKEILQDKLDSLGKSLGLEGSGIVVDYLTIKDLHPPFWRPDRADPSQPTPIGGQIGFTDNGIEMRETPQSRMQRGPASAFEFVNSMSEFHDLTIALTRGDVARRLTKAHGDADVAIKDAEAYSAEKVAQAHAEADRLVKMTENLDPKQQKYQLQLLEQQLLYATLKDLLDPVSKIVTDPDVKDVHIWQQTDNGPVPMNPGGR